jgi:DNA-binding NarL/FixJ family response regulator
MLMEQLLLVEHNLLFREGLALLLKWRTGLSSVFARSLGEAQDVLEEANRKPACVIVDLDLPDREGTDLLKELSALPVLALIRSRNLEREAEAMGLGAEKVLLTGSVEKIAASVQRLIVAHLADAPHPARLLPYLCDVTRGGGPKTLRASSRLSEGEGT